MAKNEKIGVTIPVGVELDRKSVANLHRAIQQLAKEQGTALSGVRKLADTSSVNLKQIKELSKSAKAFGDQLSKSAQSAVKELAGVGKQFKALSDEAEELEVRISGAVDPAEKKALGDRYTQVSLGMLKLNKTFENLASKNKRHVDGLHKLTEQQKRYQDSLHKTSQHKVSHSAAGAASGIAKILQGNHVAGMKGIGASIRDGIAGAMARRSTSGGGAGGGGGAVDAAEAGKSLEAALGGLSAGVAAIAAFAAIIAAASGSMANLNKALVSGSGLANEWGAGIGDYTKAIDGLRKSAVEVNGPLMMVGMRSEDAMKAVGAFSKNATGSIVKTEIMLRNMGGGDLNAGLLEFSKNAQIYGKALGMESEAVASTMGNMVSDIGVDATNVQKMFGDVVKQASQAGMPVHKFMDIFHQAIPDMDLFTNRMDELTGTVKLLSKSMDPRAVKGFMQAFGKGFDQLDFKQRLKMALVVGPGEMGKIMQKDISRAGASVRDQLPESLQKAFDEAMSGGGNMKKMAQVAAKAQAMGLSGATVGNLNKLARYKQNSQGGVLKQASGMRDMGLMGRMEAMEKYADAFTGGDMSGLGEHVIKMLGVSEAEYKALLDLKASMATYTQSVEDTGRTSSKSINEGLLQQLGDKSIVSIDDPKFELAMKTLAKSDPKKLQDMIKTAATMQIESDTSWSKENEKNLGTMEDFAKEQVVATTSIGDMLKNVVQVLLEKIYFVLDDMLKSVGSLYDMLPSWLNGKTDDTTKLLNSWSTDAKKDLGSGNMAGVGYYQQTNKSIIDAAQGTDAAGLYNGKFNGLIQSQLGYTGNDAKDHESSMRERLSTAGMSQADQDRYMDAAKAGRIDQTKKMLTGGRAEDESGNVRYQNGLGKEGMMKLLSSMAFQEAKKMEGHPELAYGTSQSGSRFDTKKETMAREIAKKTGDLDQRTMDAYSSQSSGIPLAAVSAGGKASRGLGAVAGSLGNMLGGTIGGIGGAFSGGPSSSVSGPAKVSTDAAVTTAKATEQHASTAEDQLALSERDYQATGDLLSLMKKGVKFESTFWEKYKKSMTDGTLESLRTALFEFAMLTNSDKVAQWHSNFKDAGVNNGSSAMRFAGNYVNKESGYGIDKDAVKPYADGGWTGDSPHMALMHDREFVVPKNGALVMGGGGRSVTVNGGVNVHVYGGDPKEIENKVNEIFSRGG